MEHTDYRLILREELARRREKNPSYSMRAFAKTLGVTEPALSQVFAGKKNFSAETALQIAASLKMSERDAEHFVLSVQLKTAKSRLSRQAVEKKLDSVRPKIPKRIELDSESFREISDWYHLVLFQMTLLSRVDFGLKALARRLGISPSEAQAALKRLIALQLIEIDPSNPKRYRIKNRYSIVKSEVSDEGLRHFHKQMLEKAIESLSTQTPREKIIGSETFAFNENDISEAQRLTEEYFENMAALAKLPSGKTQVYHLGVQFFNATKETPS